MTTKRRIYMGEAALAAGADIRLSGTHANYLHSVLRLRSGDAVHVFNALHGEWLGEIESVRKGEVKLRLQSQSRPPPISPSHFLTLSFSPLKKDRTDFLVEKASEIGVHALQPVFTDHTQSERVNIQRLQAAAIEAAEQCDRLDAPQVLEPVKLKNYLDNLFRHPGEGRDPILFLAAESGVAFPIAESFEELKKILDPGLRRDDGSISIHFLIGPEGGFSPAEFAVFDRYPNIRRLRLGPRLLRAETAAVAVLSVFQAVMGDWQSSSWV